jgi:hypothetical protein
VEQPPGYAETLTPPPSWWAMGAGVVVAVFWCFVVATPLLAAVIAAAVATVVVGWLLVRSAVRVAVTADGLRAGAATLPMQYVGEVEVLDADRTRRLLGVEADARAHLVVRSYCRTAVRMEVDDPRDPTPYWVISSRRPDQLALHLRPRSMRD